MLSIPNQGTCVQDEIRPGIPAEQIEIPCTVDEQVRYNRIIDRALSITNHIPESNFQPDFPNHLIGQDPRTVRCIEVSPLIQVRIRMQTTLNRTIT
jgi:hypothetical protein